VVDEIGFLWDGRESRMWWGMMEKGERGEGGEVRENLWYMYKRG